MKRILLMLLAAMVSAMLFFVPTTGRAQDGKALRIIFITHGQAGDPYWNAIKNGLAEAAKTYNAEVRYQSPDVFDMSAMGKLIDSAIATKPDGIVVSIPDGDALRTPIESALAAGIPVIGIDSGLTVYKKLGVMAYLGQDEYAAGVSVGKRLKETGATHIMCINMEVGNTDLDNRCRGVKDGSGVEQTILPVTMTDPVDAKARIMGALQQNPAIDAIIALGPTSAAPMLAAVEEIDAGARLKAMATFDMTPEILEKVADGTLLFATDAQQFLMGYIPVVLIHNYLLYGVMPGIAWPTGPGFVTKEDAAGVIELSRKGFR